MEQKDFEKMIQDIFNDKGTVIKDDENFKKVLEQNLKEGIKKDLITDWNYCCPYDKLGNGIFVLKDKKGWWGIPKDYFNKADIFDDKLNKAINDYLLNKQSDRIKFEIIKENNIPCFQFTMSEVNTINIPLTENQKYILEEFLSEAFKEQQKRDRNICDPIEPIIIPKEEEDILFDIIKNNTLDSFDLNKSEISDITKRLEYYQDLFEEDNEVWFGLIDLRDNIDKNKCPILYNQVLNCFGETFKQYYTGELKMPDDMLKKVKKHTKDNKDVLDLGFYVGYILSEEYDPCNTIVSVIDSYTMEGTEYEFFIPFKLSDNFSKKVFDLVQQVRDICNDKELEEKVYNNEEIERD